MRGGRSAFKGVFAFSVSALAFTIAACSQQAEREEAPPSTAETASATTTTTNASTTAAAPAAAAAPAPDNTDTLDGTKLASFTGDAAKGETVFAACRTCHAVEPGANRIGPSLHALVGRPAGQVAGYSYSPANKNSGITWTPEKLFQYLEKPQRVVPGTKMVFPGIPDAQRRADVIAYLRAQS